MAPTAPAVWRSSDNRATALSALQRRLHAIQARPTEAWLLLVENVPSWPAGARPDPGHPELTGAAYAYAPSQGLPQLLEAVVARERTRSGSGDLTTANVAITAGAMHGLGVLFREFAQQGFRHALCQSPTFRGVHDSMRAAGLSVSPVLAGSPGDAAVLDRQAGPGTLVYVNLPHNPTGRVPTAAYHDLLTRTARRGVVVVYDAVYDSFVFEPEVPPAPVGTAVASPHVVVVNSLSKNYGRPGDRIGWIIAHETVVSRLLPRLEWETVAVSGTSQLAAASVIAAGNAALVDAVHTGRLAFHRAALDVPRLDPVLPGGGTQVWLDLGLADVEAFADFALSEFHLVLTTSSNYSPAPPGHIRFPTGLPPETIAAGVDVLHRAITAWLSRGA